MPKKYRMLGDMAVLPIQGMMIKGESYWGDTCDMCEVCVMMQQALADPMVRGIALLIDSPGGTVAGTQQLADAVFEARNVKPVFAYIDDLGASAAYWVASQATKVYANGAAQIGSIGAFAVIEDTSKLYEAAGVAVHVVATGEYKGAFQDGAPVTPPQLEYLQEVINDSMEFFSAAVKRGRGLTPSAVTAVSDGRVWIAKKAQAYGLIDGVRTFQSTMEELQKQSRKAKMNIAKASLLLARQKTLDI